MCLHTKRTIQTFYVQKEQYEKEVIADVFLRWIIHTCFLRTQARHHVTSQSPEVGEGYMCLHTKRTIWTFYIQKEQDEMKSSQMFFFAELFILIFYVHKHISSEVFLWLNYSYSFSTYTSTSAHHFTTKTKHSQTHITTTNNTHRPSPRALPSNGKGPKEAQRQRRR